jgi:hypothetical protein
VGYEGSNPAYDALNLSSVLSLPFVTAGIQEGQDGFRMENWLMENWLTFVRR